MMDFSVDDVLEFLKECRTRQEIIEKFGLSRHQFANLTIFLERGKFISKAVIRHEDFTNRVWIYYSI